MRSIYKAVQTLIILFLSLSLLPSFLQAQSPVRERIKFNADWRFQKDDPAEAVIERDSIGKPSKTIFDYPRVREWVCATGAAFTKPSDSVQATKRPEGNLGAEVSYTQPAFYDSGWRALTLPHDWGIESDFNINLPGNTAKLPWPGVGWYRKHFMVPITDRGRQLFLDIDGAMAYAMVWLNGEFVGSWPYGYNSFRLELTPYIKPGAENVLAIRLYNPPASSRWYPGSGIYRNVWLVKTSPVHVAQWGTYITTPEVSASTATIDLKITVDNQTSSQANVKVATSIFEIDAAGNKSGKALAAIAPMTKSIGADAQELFASKATLKKPKLWSTANPQRYVAVTTITHEGKTVDVFETTFGIRTISFDADKGFLLNGSRVDIKGVCNHHDLGALGIAFNTRAAERQIEIMKEMGVNALRTSHNMPAPEILDLCDRMGIMVQVEAFDCWRKGKTANDYHLLFDDWHYRDLRAMVRRDRNHPSVIQWSTGNEVQELRMPNGAALSARLAAIVKEEDPTRTTATGSNNVNAGLTGGFQNSVDVYGQNYHTEAYSKFREANPRLPLLASETSSAVSSRGEYYFPVTDNKIEGRGRFQMSSYDLYSPRWGCSPDHEFEFLDKHPFISGEYVWTGFDYLGEPTPFNGDVTNLLNIHDEVEKAKLEEELKKLGKLKSPSRSSYFGIVDLAGFKKDRFYIYQSRWRADLPMAHILPHWNWSERVGQITPIHIYTSGDEAELFLNGKSLGRKKKAQYQYRLRWDSVTYEPGEVKVIAYKNGKRWAEDNVKTTGPATKLKLQADRSKIKSDGEDLSFITVTITDKDGQQVPRANNHIHFEISGPGEIAGVDNGDATSFESFKAKEHSAFNGLALVIIKAKAGEKGNITLKASAEGLEASSIVIASE